MTMNNISGGWGGYPSAFDPATDNAGGMAGLDYALNSASVGSVSKGDYDPGAVDADAAALTYLGYDAGMPDDSAGHGAWDPQFRAALANFQGDAHIMKDGWIGPQSRTALYNAVQAKNGSEQPLVPVPQVNPPGPGPAPHHEAPSEGPGVGTYIVGGVIVIAAGYGIYRLVRKKKAA